MQRRGTSHEPRTAMQIAIRLVSERDRQHLERVIDVAARRAGIVLEYRAVDIRDADLLVLRRGEPGSSVLLAGNAARPVPVVYTANRRDPHPWRLACPVHAENLLVLVDAVRLHLQQQRAGDTAVPAASPTHAVFQESPRA
ncbi:MAG: hypothetical protein ACOY33_07385 [Pseudomonadota bacterium]